MRDQEDRSSPSKLHHAGEHVVFGFRIECGGGLIHDEQRRITEEGPGNRQPLPLAAGEVRPIRKTRGENRLPAEIKLGDELSHAGALSGESHTVVIGEAGDVTKRNMLVAVIGH